jgi:GTP-binding protein
MIECNICIIGKPNVGKSTIFNKIIGEDISEVSSIAGTTVYPVNRIFKSEKVEINFFDIGGLKKKSKSHEEKQIVITTETLKKLKLSDIVLFILDANDQITKNDKQLFRLILNKLKDVIVIVNKTDLIKKNTKIREDYFKSFFEYNFANIIIKPIFMSALKDVKREFIINKIYEVLKYSKELIPNKLVNDSLNKIISYHKPVIHKNSRPNIKFIKHVNCKPMIFKAFGTKLIFLKKEYKNYFVKNLMSALKIYNKIVVVKYINNKNPYTN